MNKTGGPAFPVQGLSGMALRDYFAAKALSMLNYHNILHDAFDDSECALQIQNAAVLSYRLADAMIAERDKESA